VPPAEDLEALGRGARVVAETLATSCGFCANSFLRSVVFPVPEGPLMTTSLPAAEGMQRGRGSGVRGRRGEDGGNERGFVESMGSTLVGSECLVFSV
jgi:hypothetical protein